MSKRLKSTKEESPKVPAYIVTFSDMTTLLLTFFVMLLSLASMHEELFGKGRDSFSFSLRTLGMGTLIGKKSSPDFGNMKVKYFIKEPDVDFKGRTIHRREEEIRQAFNEVRESMKTMPSEVAAERTDFTVTSIRFEPGGAQFNEAAKQYLSNFCANLQQNSSSRAMKLYVLGLSNDQADDKGKWILSAKRAKVVADYMRVILSAASGSQEQRSTFGGWTGWPVYWWGAGPGGDWVNQDSPISKQSQILIAVLRSEG